eukprot:746558-Hanusia_phi.AAC.9
MTLSSSHTMGMQHGQMTAAGRTGEARSRSLLTGQREAMGGGGEGGWTEEREEGRRRRGRRDGGRGKEEEIGDEVRPAGANMTLVSPAPWVPMMTWAAENMLI